MKDKAKSKVCEQIINILAKRNVPPLDALTILTSLLIIVVGMVTTDPKKRVKIVDVMAKAIKSALT